MTHAISSLTTARLLLRLPEPDDVDRLVGAVRASLPGLGAWLPWAHSAYGPNDAVRWIEDCAPAWHKDEQYAFSLFDPASGDLLGGCGLNFIDRAHARANLGYWLRDDARGRGLAVEATRAVARFGIESLGFERLEIVAAVDNLPSQRVAERSGAQREGIARRRICLGGRWHDAVCYSIVSGDAAVS
ncbi:MAG: GNAT family N-acetyltransferase [Pirellulales bacterium]|nr:GNAT family N-acetyltransferase [Pirellulales bacterium]